MEGLQRYFSMVWLRDHNYLSGVLYSMITLFTLVSGTPRSLSEHSELNSRGTLFSRPQLAITA